MRTAKKTVPTLDLFRLAAVLLVVMPWLISGLPGYWPGWQSHSF